MTRLILASASPRRTQILDELDIAHDAVPADIDESQRDGESAEPYVRRMAREKAERVAGRAVASADLAVLGADTAVTLDGTIYGKPASEPEAVAMLTTLGGRTHRVISAIALSWRGDVHVDVVASDVSMRSISPAEARCYWATGEPRDKAGGYAIQGRAAVFVERLSGSYTGTVGLPVFESLRLLAHAGIRPRWLEATDHG